MCGFEPLHTKLHRKTLLFVSLLKVLSQGTTDYIEITDL